MSETRISNRYAKSLLSFALEKNATEEVRKDADNFLGLIKEHRELLNVLRSPVVAKEIKLRLLDRLFKDSYNELTYKFLRLVIKKRREAFFTDIFKSFIDLYNHHFRISHAEITTAVSVDEQLLEKARELVAEYTDTTVHINNKVSEEIVGGFVLRFSDKRWDASVASYLKSIKKELAN